MSDPDLIPVLRGLPPFHLRLVELTWQVVGEDGHLNAEKIGFLSKELMEAIEEAENYSRSTREMVQCLIQMVRSQS
jgi:hypothetical protein